MTGELQKLVTTLKEKPEYQPLLEKFGREFYMIFATLLTQMHIERPGDQLDGAMVLSTLMVIFNEIAKEPERLPTTVTPVPGLPSERYGRTNS